MRQVVLEAKDIEVSFGESDSCGPAKSYFFLYGLGLRCRQHGSKSKILCSISGGSRFRLFLDLKDDSDRKRDRAGGYANRGRSKRV
jgi:hypothetical protein